jgi:hypothetical protein
MKTSKTILFGQTLLDIASQELGDASRAFEIAVMNNMSLTDDLVSGETLLTPDADTKVRGIIQLFSDSSKAPASADVAGEMKSKSEGVEFWKLENDFIIQ